MLALSLAVEYRSWEFVGFGLVAGEIVGYRDISGAEPAVHADCWSKLRGGVAQLCFLLREHAVGIKVK